MERAVVRMTELDVFQALVRRHEAVAYDLDLGLVRDGLEIRVQNASFGVGGRGAMAIGGRGIRIEALSELILGLGSSMALVLENKNLVFIESFLKNIKVGI